jgi:hypothetical protein
VIEPRVNGAERHELSVTPHDKRECTSVCRADLLSHRVRVDPLAGDADDLVVRLQPDVLRGAAELYHGYDIRRFVSVGLDN